MEAYRQLRPVYADALGMHEPDAVDEGGWADDRLRVQILLERQTDVRTRIVSRWTCAAAEPIRIQPELRLLTAFVPEHYAIPGVSIDGNHWGKGNEPKGLEKDGEPWVFEYHRTPLPSCTLTEDREHFVALMASDRDAASLTSSCSMIRLEDGRMIQRLLYPMIERPLTYCDRDRYTDPLDTWIALAPGETFEAEAWLISGEAHVPFFAAAIVEDEALEVLGRPYAPRYTHAEVEALALSHAGHLLQTVDGRRLFCIGMSPEGDRFVQRTGNEFGWCGQNGMYARLAIQLGFRDGRQDLIDLGIDVLDAYAVDALYPTGLVCTQYDRHARGERPVTDTCNLGFFLMETARAWSLLKAHGVDRP